MKKVLLIITLAALSAGAAFAQGKLNFYDVVPRHEFFFEGFGGLAPLMYSTESVAWGPTEEKPDGDAYFKTFSSDLFNWDTKTGIGYGGGFGYIWHFHPNVGLMLGAEFAVYNGGIRMNGGDHENNYFEYAISAEVTSYDNGGERVDALVTHLANEYAETQQYMAVQVPLMLQLMAPMGKGKNHFYFAFGAKAGFNVRSTFRATAEGMFFRPVTFYYTDWADVTGWTSDVPALATVEEGSISPLTYMNGGSYTNVKDDNEPYEAKGTLRPRLFNPMASAELGFRWRLGGKCGLYTGLYADYGFLPLMPAPKGGLVTMEKLTFDPKPDCQPQSLLNSEMPPYIEVRTQSGIPVTREFRYGPLGSAASKVHSLHAGLKLKIAFGK